ncbi:hypothetical protein [Acidovorax sp. FG27]|uniref:hypothetical protein n=1 Tax=Acidovorax sp. FG27 TaxID=3133652 RepID=UPI0030E9F983
MGPVAVVMEADSEDTAPSVEAAGTAEDAEREEEGSDGERIRAIVANRAAARLRGVKTASISGRWRFIHQRV